MYRCFTDEKTIQSGFQIDGDDAVHISKSLRMKPDDILTVCSADKIDYLCKINSISDGIVQLDVLSAEPNNTEPRINVHLYQCMPKGDKLENIVQKSVEMGVVSITPILSSRCISRPDEKSMRKKILRLQKIAHSAAEQSMRGIIPKINPMISFKGAVEKCEDILLFYENATDKISDTKIDLDTNMNIFIGSEGGFDESEVEFAKTHNANILSLGKRILRTETAPIAALSALMYRFGEL